MQDFIEMMDYIKDYAFLTELLNGGYTYHGAGLRQCSNKIQKLFLNNDFFGIISYGNSIVSNKLIELKWIKAIKQSSAIRYFILCGFHDAEILNISYNNLNKILTIEMWLYDCCHGLELSEKDKKRQRITLLFSGVETDKNNIDNFNDESHYYFKELRLDVGEKVDFKLLIAICNGSECCENWLDIKCDEVYFAQKC